MPLISERDREFFRPLWRRVALIAVLGGWTTFELIGGEETWAWMAGGLTALSVWLFFISFNDGPAGTPKAAEQTPKTTENGAENGDIDKPDDKQT